MFISIIVDSCCIFFYSIMEPHIYTLPIDAR